MKFMIKGFDRATDKELSVPYAKQENHRAALNYIYDLITSHPDMYFELIITFE